MPALDFQINIAWPVGVQDSADRAETFRGSVVRAARREMQKIADEAASNTPFEKIRAGYHVQQETTTDPISIKVINDAPTWIWSEIPTIAHWMPWADPASRIAYWM